MPLSTTTPAKSKSILGVLLPRLFLIAILTDLGLRWVPKTWLAPVRSPAARVYTPADALSGSFVPGIRLRGPSYGDLARIGNLRTPRIYREQEVEIDALGYVNPPYLLDSHKIDVLMVGDSFLTATSLGREKMLAGQLEHITGLTVYNAGRPNLVKLQQDLFLNLVSRLRFDHGAVVFELQEVSRNVQLGLSVGRLVGFARNRLGTERWEQLRATASQYSIVDGAQLFSQALLLPLQDGRIFPNPFANLVTVCQLQDGQPMAFLNSLDVEARFDSSSELIHRWADFLEPVSKTLEARGLRFLVVLVPYKLAVYAPLLRGCQFDVRARWQYFYGLEDELRSRNIRVINALPPLRIEAEALLERGETVYWPDDTHWNDAGIAVTARLIAHELQP